MSQIKCEWRVGDLETNLASRAWVWLIAWALPVPLLECVDVVQASSLHPSSTWLDHPTPTWDNLPWVPDFKNFWYHPKLTQDLCTSV